MAKQIIVLERLIAQQGQVAFRIALWAQVPIARQSHYASTKLTSAFKDATAQELTDIQNGVVIEQVITGSWLLGTPIATIQAELQATFTSFQNDITNNNPWQRYGTNFDGTLWNSVTIA